MLYWQNRYGLQEWDVKLEIIEPEDADEAFDFNESDAETRIDTRAREALIELHAYPDHDLDTIFAHELLHIPLEDLRLMFNDLASSEDLDVDVRSATLRAAFYRALEQAMDVIVQALTNDEDARNAPAS